MSGVRTRLRRVLRSSSLPPRFGSEERVVRMSRGTGRRRCGAVAGIAVAAAWVAAATSAQAVSVDLSKDAYGTTILEICCWNSGERNDITLQPVGSVPGKNANDSAFPNEPLSVLVTDTATPLSGATGRCVQISANSARCIEPDGIDTVDASLGPGTGRGTGDSFTVDPGSDGSAAPMYYFLQTSEANDTVSIPVSRGMEIATLGGNDTITAADPSGVRLIRIWAGAGNDRVRLTTTAAGTLDCGDGIDDAQIVGAIQRLSITGCEKVTP